MPVPLRQRLTTSDPAFLIEVTDDGSRTLVWRDSIGEIISGFHSGCGAAAECDWVYLRNGGMTESPGADWPHTILEIGLGTGLAMLRTLDRAIATGQRLRYVALETSPVDSKILEQLGLGNGLLDPRLADRFLERWSHGAATSLGTRSPLRWQVDSLRQIEVHFQDVRRWIPQAELLADTIYFDPFDPEVSPELWQRDVFEQLWLHLRPGGRLVTYCVKGEVRRTLVAVGFDARRVSGPPGGKRDVLVAMKPTA